MMVLVFTPSDDYSPVDRLPLLDDGGIVAIAAGFLADNVLLELYSTTA
jgi:hypothetical protein